MGSVLSSKFYILHKWLTSLYIFSHTFLCSWHYTLLSTPFVRHPSQSEFHYSRRISAEGIIYYSAILSVRGKQKLVSLSASKVQFLHLSTQHNLPRSYPSFVDDTQFPPFNALNIRGLYFTRKLTLETHIFAICRAPLMKLCVLCLIFFLTPPQWQTLYKNT